MSERYADVGLRLEHAGVVTTITMCRPEVRNAQSPKMWAAVTEISENLSDATRVVVLRAEGESFSAGLDRRMFAPEGIPGDTSLLGLLSLDDPTLADHIAMFQRAFSWWRRDDIISIAAVQGHAVGAGFQLALACDLRVVADDAKFAMRETSLGLVPDLAGTAALVEAVGYSRALEICATGRWVEAAEAKELGLATIVVPRDDLDATVSDLAAALTTPPHSAVTATKALLRDASARTYDEQLLAERTAQVGRLRDLAAMLAGNK